MNIVILGAGITGLACADALTAWHCVGLFELPSLLSAADPGARTFQRGDR